MLYIAEGILNGRKKEMFNIKATFDSALKSAWLVLKLIIPLFIFADILLYFNVLPTISFIFEPITDILGLPKEAALGIAAGLLFNLYAALAFLAPLGLSPYEWTILATFLGVAHSLIVENAIMKKLGIAHWYSWILRLGIGFISVLPLTFIPQSYFVANTSSNEIVERVVYKDFFNMIMSSLSNASILAIKVILLVIIIIFFMDYIKSTKLMQKYQKNTNSIFSIITGLILGITYGAGILINEAKKGSLTKIDIFYIATFLMICHSIIEDTFLFVIFGANGWLVVSIRLIFAFTFATILTIIYKRKLHEKSTVS
jgi:hypothetical protein